MTSSQVNVSRVPIQIRPDPRRVISRFFSGKENQMRGRIRRALSLPEDQVADIISEIIEIYADDSAIDIKTTWLEHFHLVEGLLPVKPSEVSGIRRLLIGSYFTMHYALEAAALFNPSIVAAPLQENQPPGSENFILSLRAVGEGHLSSIVFRTGVIGPDNSIEIREPPRGYTVLNAMPDAEFETAELKSILKDLGELGPLEQRILDQVDETFSQAELTEALNRVSAEPHSEADILRTRETILSLVSSNYRIRIPEHVDIGEMALFPVSANESRGIEDLRMVRFTDDDGSSMLYGTYTAYNGLSAFPTLLEMPEAGILESHTLVGKAAQNKGMALFPRKINGRYIMSGRIDGENLYILESDNVRVWNNGRLSLTPKYWWEFAIIGNCGSPIETPDGWLLLTHGVGPMRQYCLGAALLDLDDPCRVIGRLREPLIMPSDDERIGYVPNVVYTCGSMLHNRTLIIPYAMSDMITTFASVDLDELLDVLKKSGA